MPRWIQGAAGTRLLRATVFAVIGRPQSAKSTPRHRILQAVRKHVMAAFPAVLPCPIFALPIVLQKYSVGSNLQSFALGLAESGVVRTALTQTSC
jgi:hypothetical protein